MDSTPELRGCRGDSPSPLLSRPRTPTISTLCQPGKAVMSSLKETSFLLLTSEKIKWEHLAGLEMNVTC